MEQTRRRSTTSNGQEDGTMRLFVRGGYFDYQMFFIVVTLVLFGIMMVYSASSYRATMEGNPSYYYALRQAVLAGGGMISLVVISRINYKIFRKLAVLGMYVGLALSIIVLVIGTASHGSTRWIPIFGIQFQPAEVIKMLIIIYMAHELVAYPEDLTYVGGLVRILWKPVLTIALIATQNLSTAIVCFAIVIVMLYIASPSMKYVIIISLCAVAMAAVYVLLQSYRGDRFEAWLHPETSKNGFQVIQSLYAIGSGGLFGRGLGNSMQKMGFLPEPHNDMIFSIICEELGLFGAFVVIALFVLLLLRCRTIANNAPDRFSGFVVSGVLTHIAVQAGVNVAVVTNLIPNTGVPLPFVSYGGTSIIFLLVEVGLVLAISRYARPE
ncbi:MAG: putative peptidoglycan glycosyltransferase FtsW [Eubacteriales bacterium]|nr:putative peptidoglycan glycosyltransferase FtsW [Lachnospiraceae bacterium]MDO5127879.1 putative peptidoglycan glycosyltransferase FtsW [Eubacteriales bacterium]